MTDVSMISKSVRSIEWFLYDRDLRQLFTFLTFFGNELFRGNS